MKFLWGVPVPPQTIVKRRQIFIKYEAINDTVTTFIAYAQATISCENFRWPFR